MLRSLFASKRPNPGGKGGSFTAVEPLEKRTMLAVTAGLENVRMLRVSGISGGVFCDGEQFPAQYRGKYFFGAYLRKWIKMLDPAMGNVSTFGDGLPGFLDFDVGPDGSLRALEIGGNLYRIRHVGAGNVAPTAAANRTSGATPLTVTFGGAASSDPDGDSLSYAWDCGDRTTGSGRDVTHTYSSAGTYTARLTVSDGKSGSDAPDPITITAGNDALVAAMATPASGALYSGGRRSAIRGAAVTRRTATCRPARFRGRSSSTTPTTTTRPGANRWREERVVQGAGHGRV
jgi:hypothetical protein